MRTKITARWLRKMDACTSNEENKQAEKIGDVKLVIQELFKMGRIDDANWLIARCLNLTGRRKYAVYAAEQVIDIYEKEYPNDDRPRKAIEAAKKVIKSPSKENKAAYADDAYAAADAAYAAVADDAYAAAYAADAAAAAYAAVADDAYAAAYAAYAYAAYAYAAYDKRQIMKKQIINYGLKLLYKETT